VKWELKLLTFRVLSMFALETKQVVVFVTTCFVVHGGGSEGIMEFLENQSPLDYLSLSL
jgi:hypothetical protein